MLEGARVLYEVHTRACRMANWLIWQTDYDKSTVANRHMANWHMAKRCSIVTNSSSKAVMERVNMSWRLNLSSHLG